MNRGQESGARGQRSARMRTEDETTVLGQYLAGDPERLETFLRHARERRGCAESPYPQGQKPEPTPNQTTEKH